MAAQKFKICRYCKVRDIDPNKPETYEQYPQRWYYHKECFKKKFKNFEDMKFNLFATGTQDEWEETAWDYLIKNVRGEFDYRKFNSQWTNLCKRDDMTPKGIFYAIRYFYEVSSGKANDNNGIGIVPYVYTDSSKYWYEKNTKAALVNQKLDEQMKQAAAREVVTAQPRVNYPKKKGASLSDILSMGEDE